MREFCAVVTHDGQAMGQDLILGLHLPSDAPECAHVRETLQGNPTMVGGMLGGCATVRVLDENGATIHSARFWEDMWERMPEQPRCMEDYETMDAYDEAWAAYTSAKEGLYTEWHDAQCAKAAELMATVPSIQVHRVWYHG